MVRSMIGTVLLHVAIACCLMMVVAGVLDWYNPYMNLGGIVRPALYVQCAALILYVLERDGYES